MKNLFIGCDWGTTSLRIALIQKNPDEKNGLSIVTPVHVPAGEGIAGVFSTWQSSGQPDRSAYFLNYILQFIRKSEWPGSIDDQLPVVISGMASSSIGMQELTYAEVPFSLDGSGVISTSLPSEAGPSVYLLSGVRTRNDVARGEEIQVLGVAHQLGWHSVGGKVLVLPGTHSKHIRVDTTGITDLRTVMTGELFSLLATQSVLRHSVRLPAPDAPSVRKSFVEALQLGFNGEIMQNLFRVRVDHLSGRGTDGDRTAWLLGLLLGAELSAFRESHDEVLLCSGARHVAWYEAALEQLLPGRFTVLDSMVADQAAFLGQAVWFQQHGY